MSSKLPRWLRDLQAAIDKADAEEKEIRDRVRAEEQARKERRDEWRKKRNGR